MTDTTADPYAPRMAALADELRAEGSITSDAVYAAFAATRRDRCVTSYRSADGIVHVDQDQPPAEEILAAIYSAGTSLLVRAGDVPSSSSAPRIMARMLEALDLRAGHRVLEIGAGTGYNSALIHHITRAPVVTVEAYPPTAIEALDSIRRLDLGGDVRVIQRDGFLGAAEHGPYDRIVVTCSIAGIPPGWLDQLAPDGQILAPIRHGGVHPAITVTAAGRCAADLGADFMLAAGPLYPRRLAGRDATEALPARPLVSRTAVTGPLDQWDYNDLWFQLAALDARIDRAFMDETTSAGEPTGYDFRQGQLALLDAGGVAWMQKTGQVIATRRDLGTQLTNLVAGWLDDGRPPLSSWSGQLAPARDVADPLLVPSRWRRLSPGDE